MHEYDILYSKPSPSELLHTGTPHEGSTPHSGRFEYGSGEHAYERAQGTFVAEVKKLRDMNLTEQEIAKAMGFSSTTGLRARYSAESARERAENISMAKKLRAKGMSYQAIADRMNLPNESTARTWCKAADSLKESKVDNTAKMLEDQLKKHKYLDVGAGNEYSLGVTQTNLNTAVDVLKSKGYTVATIKVPQANLPGKNTTVKVLAPPGTSLSDIYQNKMDIGTIEAYSPNGGATYWKPEKPKSIDSSRVFVKYAEDGGTEKDGSIYIRRGVEDLSLGNSSYAQVRIALDDKFYIKGVAIYSDDIPKGYDILVNSNRHKGAPIYVEGSDEGWAKKMKTDKEGNIREDLPFGAMIKPQGQYHYVDKNGNEQLGAINKIREEGDWDAWAKTLSAQFLGKQDPKKLIAPQLKATLEDKKKEYDEIMSLSNEVVKRKLLEEFAEGCDSSAANLKAKSLPGQLTKVLVPVSEMKDNEVYAPGYPNGSKVALVRYPHGGTFEIPELIVNNRVEAAKKLLGPNPIDAIGVNHTVAGKLSGADFDGDTVICIPTKTGNGIDIKTSTLKGLEGFEPKDLYPGYPGMKRMNNTQAEMGKSTNLITDMTIQRASEEELTRAVKFSMVVIDAEKHYLDYRKAYTDLKIQDLKDKYQGGGGASTLLSRANSEERGLPEIKRKGYKPDPETGKWIYEETGRTYINKKGEEVLATQSRKRMDMVDDAYDLTFYGSKEKSGEVERLYADYANACKALANQSRKDAMAIKPDPRVPSAAKAYSKEVASLDAKLEDAERNAPRERQAQLYASNKLKMVTQACPEVKDDKKEMKKLRQAAIAEGRAVYGANKKSVMVEITDDEWTAIQAGAISPTKLKKILDSTNMDKVKELATPRTNAIELSSTKQNRIKTLANSGLSQSEIAEIIGISTATVNKYLK